MDTTGCRDWGWAGSEWIHVSIRINWIAVAAAILQMTISMLCWWWHVNHLSACVGLHIEAHPKQGLVFLSFPLSPLLFYYCCWKRSVMGLVGYPSNCGTRNMTWWGYPHQEASFTNSDSEINLSNMAISSKFIPTLVLILRHKQISEYFTTVDKKSWLSQVSISAHAHQIRQVDCKKHMKD